MNGLGSSSSDRKLARKYAVLRFEQLCLDLSNFEPGTLSVSPKAGLAASGPDTRAALPHLEAPLGDIAHHSHPERIPVIGIRLPAASHPGCLPALMAFLAEHHAHPFLRPVFLVSDYGFLPVLGRYGFAYHVLEPEQLQSACRSLHARYGMIEVRELIGATPVWKCDLL